MLDLSEDMDHIPSVRAPVPGGGGAGGSGGGLKTENLTIPAYATFTQAPS